MLKKYLLHLLLISLASCTGNNTASDQSTYKEAIAESHRLIDSLQQAGKIPGIDIAVSKNGKIVWSEGFGFADVEHQVPVKPGVTRFRIGSVSKSLTAAALGKLMDNGKVDVSQPIQTYVPKFPVKKYPITVKQVAGHIAGIRHYRGAEFLMNTRFPSVDSSLVIFSNDSLLFEPGKKYSYSSYGFNLLSAVIEGASGEKFLPFIQREVFTPLALSSTSPDKNDSIISNRTSFYQLDARGTIVNAPQVDSSYKWAGGGFISTSTDLIKFGEAHLKPGFLSEKTLTELLTPQVLINGDTTQYSMGWFRYKNLRGFGHGGGSVGGITLFQVYPDENLIIVILSNSSNTNYGNVPGRIVSMFSTRQN